MAKPNNLHGIKLFEGLNADQLTEIEKAGEIRNYDLGEIIFREGDAGSHVYCVVDGRVEICLALGDSVDTAPVHTATRGSMFGEFVLFDRQSRSAEARTIKNTTIFAVEADAFRELFRNQPQIGYRVMDNLCRILVGRINKTTCELRSSLMW